MKKRRIITFVIFAALIAVCIYLLLRPADKVKSEARHNMILRQAEELGRLELVRYNIQDIVEYKKMREWLPNSKTVLVVAGEVVSCIDLTLLRPEDITVEGDSVSIQLPMPEICHVSIDHSRSRVYDVRFGLWDTPQLVDEAYHEAENQIRRQANSMGLAGQSRDSAVKFMTALLHTLGFKKVKVTFGQTAYSEQGNPISNKKEPN